MKINENIRIVGEKVTLIPYEKKHVEKYHQWMKNPELQQLTASEPLSLEEEYQMQTSWRLDEDKCTFLILSNELYSKENDEISALIGDTNLFLQPDEDGLKLAEVEIMIAEEIFRGQRLGWEAILLMMKYAEQIIGVRKFIAKIGGDNIKSTNMFKKMNFKEISGPNIFNEITLERLTTNDWVQWLDQQITLKIEPYEKKLLLAN